MKKTAIQGILLIAISGCSLVGIKEKTIAISPGANKNDVLAALGAPGDRQFSEANEAWQYCSIGLVKNDHAIIWFVNSKVSGLEFYNTQGGPTCESSFKTISWIDAPDQTIELRKR